MGPAFLIAVAKVNEMNRIHRQYEWQWHSLDTFRIALDIHYVIYTLNVMARMDVDMIHVFNYMNESMWHDDLIDSVFFSFFLLSFLVDFQTFLLFTSWVHMSKSGLPLKAESNEFFKLLNYF